MSPFLPYTESLNYRYVSGIIYVLFWRETGIEINKSNS